MEQTKIWSRVSQWFKPTHGEVAEVEFFPEQSPDSSAAVAEPKAPLTARSGSRNIERLEAGYSQLAGVIDKIRDHLSVQDTRSAQMTDALSGLAGTVAKFPEAAEAQSRQLGAIADRLESINNRAAGWENAASQIPRLAEAQRDTLGALRSQIDASSKSHEQIVRTMTGLHDAVGSLTKASEASADSLKFLQLSSATRDDHLIKVLTEQHRRFNRLFVTALLLTGVLTVVLCVSLFK